MKYRARQCRVPTEHCKKIEGLRAEQERIRVERLAEKLRQAGIELEDEG
jgi:hypothetical protein